MFLKFVGKLDETLRRTDFPFQSEFLFEFDSKCTFFYTCCAYSVKVFHVWM